jgi:hypothetical protein
MRVVVVTLCSLGLLCAVSIAVLGIGWMITDGTWFDDGPSLRGIGLVLILLALPLGLASFLPLRSLWRGGRGRHEA